jgi:hypothetical protein
MQYYEIFYANFNKKCLRNIFIKTFILKSNLKIEIHKISISNQNNEHCSETSCEGSKYFNICSRVKGVQHCAFCFRANNKDTRRELCDKKSPIG